MCGSAVVRLRGTGISLSLVCSLAELSVSFVEAERASEEEHSKIKKYLVECIDSYVGSSFYPSKTTTPTLADSSSHHSHHTCFVCPLDHTEHSYQMPMNVSAS